MPLTGAETEAEGRTAACADGAFGGSGDAEGLEATPKRRSTAFAMRFLALTAMRSYAVRYAEIGQITLGDKPVWDVPGAQMKGPKDSKRPLTVPLSRQAVDVVNAARDLAQGRFLFPGSQSVDR